MVLFGLPGGNPGIHVGTPVQHPAAELGALGSLAAVAPVAQRFDGGPNLCGYLLSGKPRVVRHAHSYAWTKCGYYGPVMRNVSQGQNVTRFGTTAWPPGVVFPEPMSVRLDAAGGVTARALPPDFAARELLAVNPEDAEAVEAWTAEYGPPSRSAFYAIWDAAPPEGAEAQALALRRAQQAATYVLAEILDSDHAPEPYALDWPDAIPEQATPGFQAFLWSRNLLQPRAPFIATDPAQVDAQNKYGTWDEIAAVQLYNYVSQRPTWQHCDNAPWHGNVLHGRVLPPWFTVQRTDRRKRGGHGPQDAGKRVRFCTRECAKAYTERERRRRAKEARDGQ